jgi:hypothetical protein
MASSTRLATLLGAALIACSNVGEPGSCFRPADNTCVEYGRPSGAAGKRLCSGMTWTPGDKTCPAAGRLGVCIKPSGSEYVYGGSPNDYTPSGAKNACEWAGGVFTPE